MGVSQDQKSEDLVTALRDMTITLKESMRRQAAAAKTSAIPGSGN